MWQTDPKYKYIKIFLKWHYTQLCQNIYNLVSPEVKYEIPRGFHNWISLRKWMKQVSLQPPSSPPPRQPPWLLCLVFSLPEAGKNSYLPNYYQAPRGRASPCACVLGKPSRFRDSLSRVLSLCVLQVNVNAASAPVTLRETAGCTARRASAMTAAVKA